MRIITTLCAFALVLLLPTAYAAEKQKAAETAKKEATTSDAKRDHYPLYGQIVSITASTLTIKGGEGKPDRKFDMTKDTVIRKDDKAATAKDATEGQWVGGYVKRSSGKGYDEIVSLNLSAKQKEIKSEEKKPEAKATPKKKKK